VNETHDDVGPLLRLSNVTKLYGSRLVLDAVSLDVAAHSVVCLVGSSGSGKSTLLRCVNRLEEIQGGRIELGGRNVHEPAVSVNELRQRVGIVFQSYNLFPHLTVLDNVTLGPRKARGIGRAEAEHAARDVLARLGMGDFATSYPDRLSGGQQQRVAIARALANDPQLLLLDEITAALDPELVGSVLRVIRDLKAQGMTMVMATHEMSFAREIADVVCFLDGGRILEYGPPEQLFSAPIQPRTREFLARIIEAGRL
jgi:polar amino acid transport system ATP-binding protein